MNLTRTFNQIGKSCGIFTLVIASNLFNKNSIKIKEYNNILVKCIENNYTFIGEVFDINQLLLISKKMFPLLKCEVRNINSSDDIDKYLLQGLIILPIDKDNIPHYILLKLNNNKIKAYNNFPNIYPNSKELYALNKCISNNFIWTEDIINPSSKDIFITVTATYIISFSTGKYVKKYYTDILKKSVIKNKLNVGYKSNVNMNGKCILVTKPI